MRILLTGGSGMVGSNIFKHPLAAQHDWLRPSRSELDLRELSEVRAYIGKYKPEFLIHTAGYVGGIHANIREPLRYLLENLEIGKNILLAAEEHGVEKCLNLGSTCMYPRNRKNPLREDDILTGPLEPTNEGYAIAKIATMKIAEYINLRNETLRYKTLIPSNLYGPYDSFDPNRSHLIPAIIHKIHDAKINRKQCVEIWGDGTARREFLYVQDFVDAIYIALDKYESLPDVMNIGLGRDYSVREYYQIASSIIGYSGDFYFDLQRPVGMERKLSDITRALEWGWKPIHSVKSGMTETYQYYLHNNQS